VLEATRCPCQFAQNDRIYELILEFRPFERIERWSSFRPIAAHGGVSYPREHGPNPATSRRGPPGGSKIQISNEVCCGALATHAEGCCPTKRGPLRRIRSARSARFQSAGNLCNRDGPYRAALVATPRLSRTAHNQDAAGRRAADLLNGRIGSRERFAARGGRLRTLTSSLAKRGQGLGL
jgi:hypothetical protein